MKKSKKKQPEKSINDLPYDIGKIVSDFIVHNCIPIVEMQFGQDNKPYIESEIRIVLHENGRGLIHVLGRDSQTIEFNLNSTKAVAWMSRPSYLPEKGLDRILQSIEHVRSVVKEEAKKFHESDAIKP